MRNQTNFNKLVGRKDNEYYFCDYIFDDTMHDKPFCGATGSILNPISQAEYDERMTVEGMKDRGYDDLWKQSVEAGSTELGLDEWLEYVLEMDGESAVFVLTMNLMKYMTLNFGRKLKLLNQKH